MGMDMGMGTTPYLSDNNHVNFHDSFVSPPPSLRREEQRINDSQSDRIAPRTSTSISPNRFGRLKSWVLGPWALPSRRLWPV